MIFGCMNQLGFPIDGNPSLESYPPKATPVLWLHGGRNLEGVSSAELWQFQSLEVECLGGRGWKWDGNGMEMDNGTKWMDIGYGNGWFLEFWEKC